MLTRIGAALCILSLLLVIARQDDMTAVAAQQSSRPEQVVNPKTALLDRLGQLKRSPIDYRGDRDGQQRIRYEWCTTVVDDFLFVKEQLLAEASMGREHSVREQWFFRDVTLTYQEILANVVYRPCSGGFLSDAIDEGHTVDDLGDQLRPVQRSPLFLRGHRQLEHHRQAGQSAARALGLLRA